DVFSHNKVKLAIIDVFGLALQTIGEKDEKRRSFQLNTLDNLNFSYSKLKAFKSIFEIDEFYDLSPTIRNHANWQDMFSNKNNAKIKRDEDFYNGFHTDFRFNKKKWNFSVAKTNKNKKRNKVKNELTSKEKTYIDNLLLKTEEYNIPTIFVCAPFNRDLGEYADSYQKLVGEYLESKDVIYIDYNKLWKELGLNKFYFMDLDHLNSKGALKVSAHISDYIKNNFKLNKTNLKYINHRYAIIKNNYKNLLAEKVI